MSTKLRDEQLKWFAWELLKIRLNPNLVNGKYSAPIIFSLTEIEECNEPKFEITRSDTSLKQVISLLEEIRGYHASKNNMAPENSGLRFAIMGNEVKIFGYTTAILRSYLREEQHCGPSVFDIYQKNKKYYISLIKVETNIEISSDILTAFRFLHQECGEGDEYVKWDIIYKEMNKRRKLTVGNDLDSFNGTNEKKIDYVYQTVAVKLVNLLRDVINNSNFNEEIIAHKYGGNYKLAI